MDMVTTMDEIRARVIIQEKGLYTISYEGETNIAEVSGRFMHEAGSVSDYPAVGDYVVATWPTDGSHSIISSVFPRKSIFVRKAAGTSRDEQVVAANIDTLFICMSLNQDFNPRRLERYIAAAWDSGAMPVVVLTKADLCDNVDARLLEISDITMGVDVLVTSSLNGDIESIAAYLKPGKTVAFVGSSGVGKSTLINNLLGEDAIKTSAIRADDDKGRHTTTHRELIELPGGAFVIDTPGMRELGLWNNEDGVEAAFGEVEAMTRECRFANCTHTNEPGCRILAALADGTLSADRWNSYLKLQVENFYNSNQDDYLDAKKAKFKEIARINKSRRHK